MTTTSNKTMSEVEVKCVLCKGSLVVQYVDDGVINVAPCACAIEEAKSRRRFLMETLVRDIIRSGVVGYAKSSVEYAAELIALMDEEEAKWKLADEKEAKP